MVADQVERILESRATEANPPPEEGGEWPDQSQVNLGPKRAIFYWPHVASQEIAGVTPKWTTTMYSDGSVTCDCPGWVFSLRKKKGETDEDVKRKERNCKHTRQVADEAAALYLRFRRGEELPRLEMGGAAPPAILRAQDGRSQDAEPIYGRRLVLD